MPTLDWIGKKAVRNHHKEVPFHLLKCDPDLSVGDPGSSWDMILNSNNKNTLDQPAVGPLQSRLTIVTRCVIIQYD
jgi:hypothetical protein